MAALVCLCIVTGGSVIVGLTVVFLVLVMFVLFEFVGRRARNK